jgi:hypothetical protein
MRHWPIKLHDAIQAVLYDRPNGQATTAFTADEINRRRLYVQKNGGQVTVDQIFLRAKNYPRLFRLPDRDTVALATPPARPRRPIADIVAQIDPAAYRRRTRELADDHP